MLGAELGSLPDQSMPKCFDLRHCTTVPCDLVFSLVVSGCFADACVGRSMSRPRCPLPRQWITGPGAQKTVCSRPKPYTKPHRHRGRNGARITTY